MIYLASPYTASSPSLVNERVHLALVATAHLIRKGLNVFSPIVYCHDMALRFGFPTDAAFWERLDEDFLRASAALYVLCIPGWEDSTGVSREIRLAELLNKPIMYVTVESLIVRVSKKAP